MAELYIWQTVEFARNATVQLICLDAIAVIVIFYFPLLHFFMYIHRAPSTFREAVDSFKLKLHKHFIKFHVTCSQNKSVQNSGMCTVCY